MNESQQLDSEGYIKVRSQFNSGGYVYTFVEKLDANWQVYSVANPRNDNKVFDYELVHFTRSEEYKLGEAVIAKRWNYPTANAFGRNGFSLPTLENARRKWREVLEYREHKEVEIKVPVNKEFTIKNLAAQLNVSYPKLYLTVKELGAKVKVVREIKNKKGKNTKVLVYQP